jgi:16S rRNA processing protein RimM
VRPPDAGETLLLPFTKAVVPIVDVAGGRIVAEPPILDEDASEGKA